MGRDEANQPLPPMTVLQYNGQSRHLLAAQEAPSITVGTVPYSRNDHLDVISILTSVGLVPAAKEFDIIPPYVALFYCQKDKG